MEVTNPEKISSIHDFPAPRNVKLIRVFLGLIKFYNKFSDKPAAETVSLQKLIIKGVSWNWNKEAQARK